MTTRNDGAHRLCQRLGYDDWGHGPSRRPLGRHRFRRHGNKTNAGPCHYLTQSIG